MPRLNYLIDTRSWSLLFRRILAGGALLAAAGCGPERRDTAPITEGVQRLTVEKRAIPRPEGKAVDGPLPRSLFLAQVVQRDETWDPAAKTMYFVLDPSQPAEGFRKVYEGPDIQYCRFLTPLLGGVGVAMGEVDPKRKKSGRRLFWFDLLGGIPGETIAPEPGDDWTDGREVWFRTESRVHRLDPIHGPLLSYPVDLSLDVLIDAGLLLGVSPIGGRSHAVLVDLVKETIEDLGDLPDPLQVTGDFDRIFPAGPAARDGLCYVSGGSDQNFALWYKSTGASWLRVLGDVHVYKNFGGMPAWLPVAYLGDRRFAVGKTVIDEVPSKENADGNPPPPDSLCATMLVDGMTGQVLEETAPIIYHGNPTLDIPAVWWSKEALEARRSSVGEADASGSFRWDEKEEAWRTDGGKVVRPGEGEEAIPSVDGRWLAVYSRWAEKGPLARIPFRIIDGATGEERSLEISLPTREGYVDHAAWQVLTSPSPDPKELEEFQTASRDAFLDPW